MKLRVGVVGCGVGASHVAAYAALADSYSVRALCDIDMQKAKMLAEKERIPEVMDDFVALCDRSDIDIIDICTPFHLHVRQALEALSKGKHVVCEKPIACSLQEIDALIDAQKRSGRLMMPIFQNRFGAGAQKIGFLKGKGVAGRAYITVAETAWRRRAAYYAVPWRGTWETEPGGPLVTLGIHTLDLILHIIGPIASVFAFSGTRVNPIEGADCVSVSMRMADGSLCSYALTTGSSQEKSRLRFCFEGSSAESNDAPYAYASEPWTITPDTEEWETRIAECLRGFAPQREGFSGQFAAFHAALLAGAEPPVTLLDARAVTEAITAVYASLRTGTASHLPLGRDHPGYSALQR
jgi:predicted dehydrogenase